MISAEDAEALTAARRDDAQGGARAPPGDVRPRRSRPAGSSTTATRSPPARATSSRPSPPSGCASSTASSSSSPSTSPSTRSWPASSSGARGAGGGRDRLGPRRGARLRQPAGRGDPDPPHRPGHRARDVLAPAPRLPRRPHRRALRADPAPRRGDRVLRGAQLAALRVRGGRLRVRLRGRRARGARPLGGPVRRLRQRRADHPRPVPRRRALEVGGDVTAHAAAPARLRGQRARALERPARAVPPVDGAGEHPGRQLLDRRAVLPPAAPAGARAARAAARRDDAEGAAAAA